MRELSLHILDLVENSVRAGASFVLVTVVENPKKDLLRIVVEDNGSGLSVAPVAALDPFYTTKSGKRTGLGLSLFRSSVEQAGGQLVLRRSEFGGLAVEATMQLSHIDRIPLGDIAATVSSVACTDQDVDLCCLFRVERRECIVRISEIVKELPIAKRCGLAVARQVSETIRARLGPVEAEL